MRTVLNLPGGDGKPQGRALTRSVVVGRDAGCDVVLEDAGVSRRHARLDPGDGGWHVTDLGSANGTWVNGARLDEAFLLGGERIRFGTVEGSFDLTEDDLVGASAKLRQTLSVKPVRRARPLAAFWVVTAAVLSLLAATLWHRGCLSRGPRAQSPAAARARARTSSSIAGVRRPVKVFCWLTW